jgi:hypothetical protein
VLPLPRNGVAVDVDLRDVHGAETVAKRRAIAVAVDAEGL